MTGEKNYTRVEPGIRVDYRDFENTSFHSQYKALNALVSEVIQGADGTGRVIWGFDTVSASGSTLTLRSGAALCGFKEHGQTYIGALLAGGPATRSLTTTGLSNGNYDVLIRLDFAETSISTRAFWDDVASPATEAIRTTATRYSADWSLIAEPTGTSPGAEWLKVGFLSVSSGAISNYTQQRDFLFEGREANSYVLADADWGDDSTDRSDTRGIYGLQGLSRFAKAALRQIQDIVGNQPEEVADGRSGARWYRKIRYSLAEMLPLDGSRDLIGTLGSRSIVPTSDNTYDLGASAGNKFRDIYSFDVISPDAHIDDVYATNSLQIDTSAGNAPAGRNHIYRDTTAKAYLHLVTDGTASPTVLKAVNFDSGTGLTVSTTDIIFPFARAMSDAYYVIQGTACTSTAAYIICPISRSSGSFTFEVRDHANGKANPGLSGTTGIIIDIVVFGMWVA